MRKLVLAALASTLLISTAGIALAVEPPGAPGPAVSSFTLSVRGEGVEHLGPTLLSVGPNFAGYVVFKEDGAIGNNVESNWSDIVVFNDPPVVPGPNDLVQHMTFISDGGAGITDALLAVTGVTVADVKAGRTVYVTESAGTSLNLYTATNSSTTNVATYNIYLDYEGQVPGASPIGMAVVSALLAIASVVFLVRRRSAFEA